MQILPTLDFDGLGNAKYYLLKENGFAENGQILFIDEATLIGSVFSENPEMYNCNMEKAIKRLNIYSKIRKEQLTEFSKNPMNKHCSYDNAVSVLNSVIFASEKKQLDKIYEYGLMLEDENIVLQRLGCPMMY